MTGIGTALTEAGLTLAANGHMVAIWAAAKAVERRCEGSNDEVMAIAATFTKYAMGTVLTLDIALNAILAWESLPTMTGHLLGAKNDATEHLAEPATTMWWVTGLLAGALCAVHIRGAWASQNPGDWNIRLWVTDRRGFRQAALIMLAVGVATEPLGTGWTGPEAITTLSGTITGIIAGLIWSHTEWPKVTGSQQ